MNLWPEDKACQIVPVPLVSGDPWRIAPDGWRFERRCPAPLSLRSTCSIYKPFYLL